VWPCMTHNVANNLPLPCGIATTATLPTMLQVYCFIPPTHIHTHAHAHTHRPSGLGDPCTTSSWILAKPFNSLDQDWTLSILQDYRVGPNIIWLIAKFWERHMAAGLLWEAVSCKQGAGHRQHPSARHLQHHDRCCPMPAVCRGSHTRHGHPRSFLCQ